MLPQTHAILTQLAQAPAGAGLLQFLPFVMILGLAYVMFILPQQQKDKRYRDLVANLKEKDHVVTNSGIYGVVTSVQRDQERATIRIDEGSGAKMRIAMWAISQVISDGDDDASPSKSNNQK